MRLLHTSDIHLQKNHGERFEALKKLIDVAHEHKVDYLTISGDLFEDLESADALYTQLRSLFSNLPFKVIIAPGNHDYEIFEVERDLGPSAVVLWPGGYIYRDEARNVTFFTVPYSNAITPDKFLNKLALTVQELDPSRFNIFLYHGDLEEVVSKVGVRRGVTGEETGKAFSLSLKLLNKESLKRINLTLAGHYHNVPEDDATLNLPVIYAGSPVSVTKSDIGKRKAVLLEIENGSLKDSSRIALDTFYYEKVKIVLKGFEEDPVSYVTNIIAEKIEEDENSQILLRVEGFLGENSVKLTEKAFSDAIRSYVENSCKDRVLLDSDWNDVKDISLLLSKPFAKNVLEKIEQLERSEEEKMFLKRTFLEALTKVSGK